MAIGKKIERKRKGNTLLVWGEKKMARFYPSLLSHVGLGGRSSLAVGEGKAVQGRKPCAFVPQAQGPRVSILDTEKSTSHTNNLGPNGPNTTKHQL